MLEGVCHHTAFQKSGGSNSIQCGNYIVSAYFKSLFLMNVYVGSFS